MQRRGDRLLSQVSAVLASDTRLFTPDGSISYGTHIRAIFMQVARVNWCSTTGRVKYPTGFVLSGGFGNVVGFIGSYGGSS